MSRAEAPGAGEAGDERGGDEGLVSWGELLEETRHRLADSGVGDPAAEARWVLEEASGLFGVELIAGMGEPATVGGVRRLDAMVARRTAGEPIQYVLGRWSFRSLDLMVDRRVLIPRPETEVVTGIALDELSRLVELRGEGKALNVVEVGTGSGAIALALAVEQPRAQVVAVERSPDALDVARANLAGVGRAATRVQLVEGDLFTGVPGRLAGTVDLVVANLPYIADAEVLDASVTDWEPAEALRSGPTGTELLERIVDEAPRWLAPDGVLVLEMAPDQTDDLAERALSSGFGEARVEPDLAGLPRAVVARR